MSGAEQLVAFTCEMRDVQSRCIDCIGPERDALQAGMSTRPSYLSGWPVFEGSRSYSMPKVTDKLLSLSQRTIQREREREKRINLDLINIKLMISNRSS